MFLGSGRVPSEIQLLMVRFDTERISAAFSLVMGGSVFMRSEGKSKEEYRQVTNRYVKYRQIK